MVRDHAHNPRAAGSASASHAATWLTCVIAAPVLYVLSIGPVIGLARRGVITPQKHAWVEKVYQPLGWVANKSKWADHALQAYGNWWGKILAKP